MKLKEGFFIRSIGDEAILVPIGQKIYDFKGLLSLNATGKFICEHLKEETSENELTEALLEDFDIDRIQAEADVKAFINTLDELGVIEK